MSETKQKNTPLYAVIGILSLLFVIPFILAMVTLIVYGEFSLPDVDWINALLSEFNATFALAILMTGLPALLVWVVEVYRRRSGGKNGINVTLAMLGLMMVIVTAIPVLFYLKPLNGVPPRQAVAILSLVGMPLLIVAVIVAAALPARLRGQSEKGSIK